MLQAEETITTLRATNGGNRAYVLHAGDTHCQPACRRRKGLEAACRLQLAWTSWHRRGPSCKGVG